MELVTAFLVKITNFLCYLLIEVVPLILPEAKFFDGHEN